MLILQLSCVTVAVAVTNTLGNYRSLKIKIIIKRKVQPPLLKTFNQKSTSRRSREQDAEGHAVRQRWLGTSSIGANFRSSGAGDFGGMEVVAAAASWWLEVDC